MIVLKQKFPNCDTKDTTSSSVNPDFKFEVDLALGSNIRIL